MNQTDSPALEFMGYTLALQSLVQGPAAWALPGSWLEKQRHSPDELEFIF